MGKETQPCPCSIVRAERHRVAAVVVHERRDAADALGETVGVAHRDELGLAQVLQHVADAYRADLCTAPVARLSGTKFLTASRVHSQQ